ncbi:MAG: hypothetical protein IPK04_09280 [Bdellovibrionales bacterium]|nr:hypothetical protein [Bdellovibrionales bacterium]
MKNIDHTLNLWFFESFETLRNAAASGVIVSILPKRVADRFDDLIELQPNKPFNNTGNHKLLVVSQLSCDKEETDFLASESARLLIRK